MTESEVKTLEIQTLKNLITLALSKLATLDVNARTGDQKEGMSDLRLILRRCARCLRRLEYRIHPDDLDNLPDDLYTQMVRAREREETALEANEQANRTIARLTNE